MSQILVHFTVYQVLTIFRPGRFSPMILNTYIGPKVTTPLQPVSWRWSLYVPVIQSNRTTTAGATNPQQKEQS